MEHILAEFVKRMQDRQVRLHGAVLMQEGKVIGEVYCPPYTCDTKTRMYSTSKSVAAVAIGKLIGEGKLSLDTKIVDVFADRFDLPEVHPFLKEQTIRHMLTMSTCYAVPTYNEHNRDWLASYFKAKPTHPCGTLWHYDSCGSYVLGAVTKHITGMDFVEYLRPEFDIMGVSRDVYCMKGPDGEAWASSAFIATTSDLARIAYLLLNKGKWEGIQLIPESFAVDAIRPLVRNDDGGNKTTPFDCGYGYQVWCHPDGAFAFRGLGGQLAIGFPGRDLVFACNADTAANNDAYDDLFYGVQELILPHFPVTDESAYRQAQRPAVKETVFESIRNKTYCLEANPMGIRKVRFSGTEQEMTLTYTRDSGEYSLQLSPETQVEQIFPQAYTGNYLFDPDHEMQYRCSIESRWLEENKLFIRVWAEDLYVGNFAMCFGFREDGLVAVKMKKYAQFFFGDFNGIAWGKAE